MACISRFATAILSGETELALGTIRVNTVYVMGSSAACDIRNAKEGLENEQ